jgi:hypothetical protein
VRLTVTAPSASGLRVTLTGCLTPRHPEGTGAVRLEFERYIRGIWASAFSVAAVTRDDGSRSQYLRTLILPSAGGWRVRAVHPEDAAHARTLTPWRAFSVAQG